jgi:hypothetical protein
MVPRGYKGPQQGKTYLHLFQYEKSLKIFSRNHIAKKDQIYLQGDLMQNQDVKIMPGVVGATMKKYVYMGNINQYDSGERCGPLGLLFLLCLQTLT